MAHLYRQIQDFPDTLMSHMSGVTSMAHTDADVELTLGAFEDTLREIIAGGLAGRT